MTDIGEQKSPTVDIDASQFQMQLVRLAEVLAKKVKREAAKVLPSPVSGLDIPVLVRKAMSTYDLLFFINADDIRNGQW
jgi:hypothetical protein